MTKIDRRKTYYMTIDTETTNTGGNNFKDPLAYDLGLAVHDRYGNVYATKSLVIYDIYALEKELMQSAYYADKLPKYEEALKNGERKMVTIFTAKRIVAELCATYNVKAIIAHNMPFDNRALNQTLRYVSKSASRYFFPYGIPLYDSLKMATDTICKQKTYIKFCNEHEGYTKKNGTPRATAEILYRYITQCEDFNEEHQGIDDVMIEMAITAKCFRQHKKMRKLAFGK